VGACIYCGKGRPEVSLEDEHIIPDGIGGNIILPKSSCRACAEKINRWEQRVQKRNLGAARDASGVRSRKRRGKRPQGRPLYLASEGTYTPDDESTLGPEIVDASKLPNVIFAETTLGRPELLVGEIPGNGIKISVVGLLDRDVTSGSLQLRLMGGDFLRLVAKIAHGFACASLGRDAFAPFLTRQILGENCGTLYTFIGSRTGAVHEELHRVRIGEEFASASTLATLSVIFDVVFVVEVQLFASLGGPIYEVVVGSKRDVPELLV
jgi:HNH endonuclease